MVLGECSSSIQVLPECFVSERTSPDLVIDIGHPASTGTATSAASATDVGRKHCADPGGCRVISTEWLSSCDLLDSEMHPARVTGGRSFLQLYLSRIGEDRPQIQQRLNKPNSPILLPRRANNRTSYLVKHRATQLRRNINTRRVKMLSNSARLP